MLIDGSLIPRFIIFILQNKDRARGIRKCGYYNGRLEEHPLGDLVFWTGIALFNKNEQKYDSCVGDVRCHVSSYKRCLEPVGSHKPHLDTRNDGITLKLEMDSL